MKREFHHLNNTTQKRERDSMSAAAPYLPELTVRSFNVATKKPELPAVQGGWHTRHIAAATLIGLASASLIVGLSLGLAYFRTNTVTNTVPVVKVVVPDWAVFPEETGVWTYVTSASNGPANWGKIVVNSSTSELMYPNCAKFAQSPINIDIGTTTVATPPTYNPQRFYNATLFKISPRPSGHPGFQVLPINGTAVWKVDGVDYYLLQFHYHSPSEHTVNGVRLPLEVHFVHQNAAGDLAVFGILYPLSGEENSGIKANPFIAAWWDQIFTEVRSYPPPPPSTLSFTLTPHSTFFFT